MATETVKTDTKAKAAAANGGGEPAKDPNRFKPVVTDRPSYKVQFCYKKPLVGYLLGVGRMPDAPVSDKDRAQGRTGEWHAFVILTTEPTLGCEMGSDTPVDVAAGIEVTLGESYDTTELRKHLRSDVMYEVSISTSGEMKRLKNGNNKRVFEIGCDFDHPVKRPAQYALTSAAPPPKQLAQSSDEIPF